MRPDGARNFALILVQNRETLQDAKPDLVDAFSRQVQPVSDVPSGVLGLFVLNRAIVIFVLAGLLALPFLAAMLPHPPPKFHTTDGLVTKRRAGPKGPKRR